MARSPANTPKTERISIHKWQNYYSLYSTQVHAERQIKVTMLNQDHLKTVLLSLYGEVLAIEKPYTKVM